MNNQANIKNQLQNNATILIVIAAALVFSLSAVWIKKSVDDFGDYRQMLEHERSVAETLEQNKQNLEGLQEEAEEFERQGLRIDDVVAALPLRLHPASDLANLELLIRISGMSIQNLTVGEEREGGGQAVEGLTPYTANITVNGSYTAVKSFLRNLEASKQPMLPVQLRINSDGGLISVDIMTTLYYQGGPAVNGIDDEFIDEEFIE